jgi:hypothetical protein
MAAYMRKTGILPVCTNDEARDYFAGKGLSYDDATEGDILALVMLLNKHIKKAKEIHMKVNTELLQKKIKDSGLKMGFIAEKLGRSRQALRGKIKGETEFLPSEVRVLCELLRLTDEERRLIFLI